MIYIEKTNVEERDFIDLLSRSKKLMLDSLINRKTVTPSDFESIVFENMLDAAKNTTFDGTIKEAKEFEFPDIIAKGYFGVEVKMTTGDHWTSTGNSVLESSRVESVQRIYIMFGKFGGKIEIKYRLYQECLSEVTVTHYPRYRINMDLADGKSIFDKMGVEYDALRKESNAVKKIKEYYRSQLKEGEELWWIDQDENDKVVSPIIKPYRNLSDEDKENFTVESMILFPELFGNSQTKFERSAAYLISEYNAVSSNLRDLFTAGGQVELKVKKEKFMAPQLAARMRSRAKAIANRINALDVEKLSFYWRSDKIEKNRLDQWKKLLDEKFSKLGFKIKASEIFESGLNEKNE